MAEWKIKFFTEGTTVPVMEWLDTLPDDVRAKVVGRMELLRKHGPTLDYPYTSQIEGKLREARLRIGKTRYILLYFLDDDRTGIVLHGFTKNTAIVEESDKAIGRKRMAVHLAQKKGNAK